MARGQTTSDYAVGMSIFLVVLAGVFLFVPSLFAPFTDGTNANTVVADRVAERLSDDALAGDPVAPSSLDAACTEAFFDADGVAPASCAYDADAAAPAVALAVDDRYTVNVTVENGSGPRTLNGTALSMGRAVPKYADVVTATRVVLLDGEQHRLYVRVW